MVATLIDAVKLAKFVNLGYRAHSDNRWDRALDALEGGVVKRAATETALARGSAAATSPSSATSSPLLAALALDINDDGAGRTARQRCASCPTGGQL